MIKHCINCNTPLIPRAELKIWHCVTCVADYTQEFLEQAIVPEHNTEPETLAMPVTGHRTWGLDTEKMRLTSAYGGWDTGFMEAVCHAKQGDVTYTFFGLPSLSQEGAGHRAPHWPEQGYPSCMCGVNAYKLHQPVQYHPVKAGEPVVVGIVDLGGRVYEYEHGYRAQYGRIMEATVITNVPYGSRFLGYLSEKYEAPFRAMAWHDYFDEWRATHGRDWETETEDRDTETGATTSSTITAGAGPGAVTSSAEAGKGAGYQLTQAYLKEMHKALYPPLSIGEVGIGTSISDVFPRKSRLERFADWLINPGWHYWVTVAVLTGVPLLSFWLMGGVGR